MSKSIENATRKRAEIVATAESLFLQHGYAEVSMDRIAHETGVTKQTVYRYYPSKEVLFSAVMERVRDGKSPGHTFGKGKLAVELRGFGEYLLAFHLRPQALGLYKLMLVEGGNSALHKTFMTTGPQKVIEPLIEFLQQRIHEPADPCFHAQMFVTMILAPRNQLLMGGRLRITKAEQQIHVRKVVELFQQTLRT